MRPAYRFEHGWTVPMPRGPLFDILADVAAYPGWWRQVRAVARVDEDTARVLVRSRLPYSLDLVLVRAVEDPTTGVLEARIHGSLEGWSRWTLYDEGRATRLLYEQEVDVQAPLLRMASKVARPLLVANHAAMMRAGRRALEQLATQPRSSAGR